MLEGRSKGGRDGERGKEETRGVSAETVTIGHQGHSPLPKASKPTFTCQPEVRGPQRPGLQRSTPYVEYTKDSRVKQHAVGSVGRQLA